MSERHFYSEESLVKLDQALRSLMPSFHVTNDYFLIKFQAEGMAREYIDHGFLRRLSTMKRCIEQIFDMCPPSTCKLEDTNVGIDVGIFLQSFYIHLYGAFENLARVSVEMSGVDLTDGEKRTASFLSKKLDKKVKAALPPAMLTFFSSDTMRSWREHLNDFRHTLAHRIPLYIPPYSVRPEDEDQYIELGKEKERLLHEWTEWTLARPRSPKTVLKDNEKADEYEQKIAEVEQKQKDLEFFTPVAIHSYTESGSPFVFHGQIIANWNTILEFLCCFFEAMQSPLGQQLKKDLVEVGIPLGESLD